MINNFAKKMDCGFECAANDASDNDGIIISSRIRLARNLSSIAFPGWAGDDERRQVCARLENALPGIEGLVSPRFLLMDDLSPVERMVLQERHIISCELAEGGGGRALLLDEPAGLAVMINEEDHLRMQGLGYGFSLEKIWQRLDKLDSSLDESFCFAFDKELGYLTACPSNLGTAMRASVMLQLSGLRLMGELDQVMNALDRLGLAVRGLLGEGTEAYGNIFQISNQSSLGDSEQQIINRLMKLVAELVRQERNARKRVLESRRHLLEDRVGRAAGILAHNRLLPSGEAIDLLATLRLGVETGIVSGVKVDDLINLMENIQPGHLQLTAGKALTPEDRDIMRSNLVRTHLSGMKITDGASSLPSRGKKREAVRTAVVTSKKTKFKEG